MSSVPQAPAPAAPPAGGMEPAPAPATPAPAPYAQPAAPSPAPAQAPAQSGQYVQVDRNRLEPWGGDYHRALSDAQAYRQYADALSLASQSGLSPQELQYMLQLYASSDGITQQFPAQGAPPMTQFPNAQLPPAAVASGVTEEQVQQIVSNALNQTLSGDGFRNAIQSVFGQQLKSWDQTKQEEFEHLRQIEQAAHAEEDFVGKLVAGMGHKLKNDDGSDNFIGVAVADQFRKALRSILADSEPAELRQAYEQELANKVENGPAYRALQRHYACPNEGMLTKASEAVAPWKTAKFQIAAEALARQTNIPETPGAGPASGPPPAAIEEMTDEEHEARAANYVPGSLAEPAAGWPQGVRR